MLGIWYWIIVGAFVLGGVGGSFPRAEPRNWWGFSGSLLLLVALIIIGLASPELSKALKR